MPTRRQLIQKIELNSDQSSVTFSGIPQTYTDLLVLFTLRSDRSGASTDPTKVQFNATGADTNHTSRRLTGDGANVDSASLSYARVGVTCGNTATAGTFSNHELYIPNYAGATNKSYSALSVSEHNGNPNGVEAVAGLWSSTAAITSLKLLPVSGTNFRTGSSVYLYGITHVPIIRGGEVSIANGYKIHTFKSTASLQVIEGGTADILVVAGGGGGGAFRGGGGGAGGAVLLRGQSLSPQSYAITIGGGGSRGTRVNSISTSATNGINSQLGSFTAAVGGGKGSAAFESAATSGGSGGGGDTFTSTTPGSGTSGQGNSGGSGAPTGTNVRGAGGGGGAGAAGTNGSDSTSGGPGGIGILFAGSYYAGGGGGGDINGAINAGGLGGGGASGPTGGFASSGVASTGGGGGGGGQQDGTTSTVYGGNGGSGIVIIRYPYDGN